MAAFMVGKNLRDRRQTKAMEDLFHLADKQGQGRISMNEYVSIFGKHGIAVPSKEVQQLLTFASRDAKVSKGEFIAYAKQSEFFRNQMDKSDADSMAARREAVGRAECAFRILDANGDGVLTRNEFRKVSSRMSRTQIDNVFDRLDKDRDGTLSFQEFSSMLKK